MNFKQSLFIFLQAIYFLTSSQASTILKFKSDSTIIINSINAAILTKNDSVALKLINYARIQIKKGDSLIKQLFYFNLGKLYFLKGNLDSAQSNCNYGITLAKNGSPAQAKFYNLQGSIFSYKNEHQLAIFNFQKAVTILESNNLKKLAAQIKNNIANIFFSLLNYGQAYKYSQAAYKVMVAENDTLYLGGVSGILGISLLKLDSLKQAKNYIDSAMYFSTKYNNILGLIIANYCKGELSLTKNNYKLAQSYFLTSLQLSLKYNQSFYILINSIGLGITQNSNRQFKLAKTNLLKALEISNKIGNKSTLYSINKSLAKSYMGINNFDSAYHFLNIAHVLYQSNNLEETQKNINQLLIKYEFEKQNKEIANKQLTINKNEKAELKSNLIIAIMLFICALFIVAIISIFKINQAKVDKIKKEEKIKLFEVATLSEEKERERISNELHDELAASLTAITLNFKNNTNLNSIENNSIVNQLIKIQAKVRSIAHNLYPLYFNKIGLDAELKNYCQLLQTEDFSVRFNCSINNFLEIDPLCAKTLYLITLELINNCIKHSNSKICFVNLILKDRKIILSIEDEGIGFNINNIKQSQGLNSIKNRLQIFNGELKIDSEINKGTLIIIELSI